jgi:hypothetical protein
MRSDRKLFKQNNTIGSAGFPWFLSFLFAEIKMVPTSYPQPHMAFLNEVFKVFVLYSTCTGVF